MLLIDILSIFFIIRLRGKLISYNKYKQSLNTIIELIDFGDIYETELRALRVLPDCFKYDPLVSET